jgi:methylated-DNA-[protein]-cysteine S-methyltransferase
VTSILVESPIGAVVVEGTATAVLRVWLPGEVLDAPELAPAPCPDPGQLRTGRADGSRAALSRAGAGQDCGAPPPGHAAELAACQLEEYFAGKRRRFELPLLLGGTAFQRSVWSALASIPYGETWSYAELAAAVGRPTAYRAVGQANGVNPIPIILPCHRVVASGGGLGGYGGGLAMKRALLALEGLESWA